MTSDGTDFFEEDEPLEDVVTAFEYGEKYVTSDGTVDDYENLPEGASPNWTIMNELGLDEEALVAEAEQGYDVDKLVPRRVTFIGQPRAGKSELAGCCGERCDGIEEDLVFEGELPGFVGMLHGGRSDLARRAKDIVRGNDGICRCPAGVCVCRERSL